VGGEALVVRPDSEGGEGAVAIATNDRNHRPSNLSEGDTALYGKVSTGQALVKCAAAGDVEVTPATGGSVKVGSASATELAWLGTTFGAALGTWINARETAYQTWNGGSKTPADVVIWVNAVSAADHAFFTAAGTVPPAVICVNFLASIAKVA
jgi:hypothetical protein